MKNRESILEAVHLHLLQRAADTRRTMADLQASLLHSGKSTAGDKHETDRAMVHLEMESLGRQMEGEKKTLHLIESVMTIKDAPETIDAGSIVETPTALFLLGPSFSRIMVGDKPMMGISLQSPLGQALHGKRKGDAVALAGVEHKVIGVF